MALSCYAQRDELLEIESELKRLVTDTAHATSEAVGSHVSKLAAACSKINGYVAARLDDAESSLFALADRTDSCLASVPAMVCSIVNDSTPPSTASTSTFLLCATPFSAASCST